MNARRIDGPNRRFRVRVRRQQHPPRLGIDLPRTLQEIHARHARHPLVAQNQRHRLLACLHLGQSVQRRLAAGRPHHAVFRSILTAQVLDNCLQNTYVVVDRQ